MPGWLTAVLLAGVVVTTAPAGSRADVNARELAGAQGRTMGRVTDSIATSATTERHDFHVSYTRMAIEPMVISAQIRLFTDDVTHALIERSKKPSMTLDSPDGEAAFKAYLVDMFQVTTSGRRLMPVVVSGSQDKDMFSYIVTWTSTLPITSLSMHNAALFELFDDQQNIVKVKHMASGRETTMFFSGGSKADQVFRF